MREINIEHRFILSLRLDFVNKLTDCLDTKINGDIDQISRSIRLLQQSISPTYYCIVVWCADFPVMNGQIDKSLRKSRN